MGKKIPKIKQIIWVEPGVFSSLAKMSEASGQPINVIIADILKKALTGKYGGEKIVERKIEIKKEVYMCPFCYKNFEDARSLRRHLKENWDKHVRETHDPEDIVDKEGVR